MTLTISRLSASHAEGIKEHLLRLSPDDRSLRFSAGLVTDESIRRYVASIPFERDAVLGLSDARGKVVGLAHGCVYEVRGGTHIEAAFSIDAGWRQQGHARGLMEAVEAFAAETGAHALVGMCSARNHRMRRVFARAGMVEPREDGEVHVFRPVPQITFAAMSCGR